MRVTNFKDVDKLSPLPHKEIEGVYVPELSSFEIQEITLSATPHAIKVAQSLLEEGKSIWEEAPVSKNFNMENDYFGSLVWGSRKAPENSYEERLFNLSSQIYMELFSTMFLCDKEGNCLCAFDEPFGERKKARMKLFQKFLLDTESHTNLMNLLLGIEKKVVSETNESESEEVESPNVKKSGKKKNP